MKKVLKLNKKFSDESLRSMREPSIRCRTTKSPVVTNLTN